MTNFSIVIPTYKRDSDLEACLCSLRKNSRKEHEIIVLYDMNNATKTICDRYAAVSLYDNARRKGTMIRSLWAIINDGIRHAKNAHVMYLNDDCLVMPGWDEIADSYFDSNLQLGLLILKTKGISNNSSFRVVHPQLFPNLVCANYAIINRRAGLFFDEHFFWYHGDSDISLQFARQNLYSVTCTEENMIIHNHRIDDNRRKHDSDIVKNNKDILAEGYTRLLSIDENVLMLERYIEDKSLILAVNRKSEQKEIHIPDDYKEIYGIYDSNKHRLNPYGIVIARKN